MATRSVRIVGGIINVNTGDQGPSTTIIENPVLADFAPWKNKARKIVHVYFSLGNLHSASGSIYGKLRTSGRRGDMKVYAFTGDRDLCYITFRAEDVSEIDITGDYAPSIYVRPR